jgi:imidazolonepropionase-like amidohydrolase
MRNLLLLLFCCVLVLRSIGQSTAPASHVQDVAPSLVAFTNCVLHVDARTAIPKATLVIKDGRVLSAGEKVTIPSGAVVRDLKGMHVWPSLIEPYSDLGLPADKSEDRRNEVRAARHWNGALRADARAHQLLKLDAKQAAELRKYGYGAVFTHRMDGIARGTSAAVLLSDEEVQKAVIQPDIAAHFSFRKGSSNERFPSSQMGAIALVRQSLMDARWYAAQQQPAETDAVLASIADQMKGRLVFEAGDRNEVLRWARILDEFQLPGIIKGDGDEYARLAAIKATGLPLIIPFALPDAYDVEDPYDAQEVSFARLKHWEMAPYNAAQLDTARVTFALTAYGRKDLKDVWRDLRRLVACGLDSARAIELLTTDPARLFGVDDRLGALRPGMTANFLITSQHLLNEKNIIHENWVAGRRSVISDPDVPNLKGTYELNLATEIWTLDITGEGDKWEARVRRPGEADSMAVKARFERQGPVVTLSFAPRDKPQEPIRLNGSVHANGGLWDGQGQKPGGHWFAWSAIRKAKSENGGTKERVAKPDSAVVKAPEPVGPITYPLVGYGWTKAPVPETVVFRDVTVWTNGSAGHHPQHRCVGPQWEGACGGAWYGGGCSVPRKE